MNVLIAGGSGLVGSALTKKLLHLGHRVSWLSRNPKQCPTGVKGYAYTDFDKEALVFDAVINLAGEPISQLWTPAVKDKIRTSRLTITEQITSAIESSKLCTPVYISGSAIGYYGDAKQSLLDETCLKGNGFLSETAHLWEAQSYNNKTRTLQLRTGIVLDPKGGILPLWTLPASLGLGIVWGDGQQFIPWIHLEDLCGLILFLIEQDQMSGAVNACSPHPVTMTAMQKAISHHLGRPQFIKIPQWLCEPLLGDMKELLLFSQRAQPQKLLSQGFAFSFPDLESALNNLLAQPNP